MDFKRHKTNRRVMADLRKRSTIGIAFYLVILMVVLISDGFYKRHQMFSIQFSIALTGICLFRLLHVLMSKKLEKINQKASDDVFFGSVILTALIWGGGFAVFLLQTGEHGPKLLMSACTVGLCAGGAIAFLPERRLSFAFNLYMMTPAFVSLQITGINRSLAIVILLYSIYLILIVFRGNREYWDALENEYMLERKSEELERLSNTDALTNIYNRRYFNEIFDSEWNRAIRGNHRLTVIICDIDHFKEVNDTFGHLAGDEYLKKVAGIIKRVFKRKTDVVARYGGEEFAVLLSDVDTDNACARAEKLRTEVKETQLIYKGEVIKTTISIGMMNCFPSHYEDKETLISHADKALYEAKRAGRNRLCDYSYESEASPIQGE